MRRAVGNIGGRAGGMCASAINLPAASTMETPQLRPKLTSMSSKTANNTLPSPTRNHDDDDNEHQVWKFIICPFYSAARLRELVFLLFRQHSSWIHDHFWLIRRVGWSTQNLTQKDRYRPQSMHYTLVLPVLFLLGGRLFFQSQTMAVW